MREAKKIDVELLKFTENCLKNYHKNLRDIQLRRDMLMAGGGCTFGDKVVGGDGVTSMERTLELLEEDTELVRLRRRTESISRFLSNLSPSDLRYIELKYFENRTWADICEELHISEQTARIRWKQRLLSKAATYMFGGIA